MGSAEPQDPFYVGGYDSLMDISTDVHAYIHQDGACEAL